jgi:hypothetical protein
MMFIGLLAALPLMLALEPWLERWLRTYVGSCPRLNRLQA